MSNSNQRYIGTFTQQPRKELIQVQTLQSGAIQLSTSRMVFDIPEAMVIPLADALVDLHEQAKDRGGMTDVQLHKEQP